MSTEPRAELQLGLGRRTWTLTGWQANALAVLVALPFLFVFGVGVATVAGWLL